MAPEASPSQTSAPHILNSSGLVERKVKLVGIAINLNLLAGLK
jgi:hypothetical protein